MADRPSVNGNSQKGAGRAVTVAVILVILILLGVIAFLAFRLLSPQGEPEEEREMRTTLVNEDNVEDLVRDMQDVTPAIPANYEVSMNLTWHFPDGSSPSTDVYVENVERNSNDVYFDLLLWETDEVIYQSPIIPLGQRLTSLTLDRALDAGTYPCVVEYHVVDKNQNTLGTLRMSVTVVVEN